MRILYMPNNCAALVIEIIRTCLELRVRYDWQAMASKLSPRWFTFSLGHLIGFSSTLYSTLGSIGTHQLVVPMYKSTYHNYSKYFLNKRTPNTSTP